MVNKDYYGVLEIEPTASLAEIAASYKRLIKQFHPDTNKADNALEKTKQLNEAYAILGDPGQRQAYDNQGAFLNRIPAGFPQGFRFSYAGANHPAMNITIVHTGAGSQLWVNGVRKR